MKQIFQISVCVMGVLLLTVEARAQETTATEDPQAQADSLIATAVEHYSARRYEEAIECFKQAYELTPEPELLYNIARSYEKMLNSKTALEWYQKFLEVPGTTGELRTRALKNIAALKQEIEAEKAIAESEKKQDESMNEDDAQKETSPEVASDPEYTTGETEPVEPTSEKDKTLKIAGLVTLGGGAALMITGGIFGGLSLAAKKDFDAAEYDPGRVALRDDMKRDALLFDVLMSVGGVAVVTGISLFVVDAIRQGSETETPTARRMGNALELIPSIVAGGDHFSAALSGRF